MGIYDAYEHLKVTQDGPVLTISLNNPPMNPIAGPRHRELSTIFREIDRDDSVKVAVLTAEGEVFSAGGDIKAIVRRHEEKDYESWPVTVAEACEITYSLLACKKPIVARINGNCLGLGASVALMCDITVIVDDAVIGDPHVKIGLTAGDGGALIWPQHIGFARARSYLLLGEDVPAKVAAEIGLVSHCVPRDELDETVNRIVQKLVRLPGPGVQTTKQVINKVLQRNFDGLVEASLGLETMALLGPEHRDAVFALRDRWAAKKGEPR
jgi:enoyl-CoA hydratase